VSARRSADRLGAAPRDCKIGQVHAQNLKVGARNRCSGPLTLRSIGFPRRKQWQRRRGLSTTSTATGQERAAAWVRRACAAGRHPAPSRSRHWRRRDHRGKPPRSHPGPRGPDRRGPPSANGRHGDEPWCAHQKSDASTPPPQNLRRTAQRCAKTRPFTLHVYPSPGCASRRSCAKKWRPADPPPPTRSDTTTPAGDDSRCVFCSCLRVNSATNHRIRTRLRARHHLRARHRLRTRHGASCARGADCGPVDHLNKRVASTPPGRFARRPSNSTHSIANGLPWQRPSASGRRPTADDLPPQAEPTNGP
jgi:hypothetical protein